MNFNIVLLFILLTSSFSHANETFSLTFEEIDEAEKNEIYQKYQLVCNVCSAQEQNRDLEKGLSVDMQYSKKYGVINYSRRDRTVQFIKHNDYIIKSGKKEYRTKYKKKFNNKDCDLVYTEDCEGALMELAAKISGKLPWAGDEVYPK